MKVALIHDQLQEFGGAERVLVALKQIYPEADVYTAFYNPKTLGKQAKQFENWKIITSWADKVPLLKKIYSPFRLITPLIWESFNFSGYDLVISSSGSYMSKGVITKPPTVHICYLHHPPRYLYHYVTGSLNELQKYTLFRIYANLINHPLRIWDYISSQRPTYFIANSQETQKRITKFYRRSSTVIYPPVNIPVQYQQSKIKNQQSYYLTVSRLQFAKHVDLLIKSANKKKFNLKIVGIGRDLNYLKSIAGPTVEFDGGISDEEMKKLFQNAKAFLFASEDDEFGIAPIEAMGYGLPVIAYASGGLKETVINGKNGFLYPQLNEDSLIEKIDHLENLPDEEYLDMGKNARLESEKYSFEIFKKSILAFVNAKIRK